MANIVEALDTVLIRYIQGTTIQSAKNVLKNCPGPAIDEFGALCIFAASTNRRAVVTELTGLINANDVLRNYLNDSCMVGDHLNFTLLVLIGFLLMASNFFNGHAYKLAFAAKHGTVNIMADTLIMASFNEVRLEIIEKFRLRYPREQFAAAVNAINGIVSADGARLFDKTALGLAAANAAW